MQSSADPFLGWIGFEGPQGYHEFYLRQLWDWKASADITTMSHNGLSVYAEICGWTLARAHACTGDRDALTAYLGTSTTFDAGLAGFAAAYADQNELDHAALVKAIADGRVEATTGI
jgi:cobyrinic acid a,c-diamide synthase